MNPTLRIKDCGRRVGRGGIQGFSLVELLVVMTIIVLLIGLVIPAMMGTLRAAHLNSGGRVLVDQLNLARQIAKTKSLPVEVRLYKLPDHGRPDNEVVATGTGVGKGVYRGFQLFSIDSSGVAAPLDKPEFFQSPVVIATGTTVSTLFADTAHSERAPITTGSNADPNVGTFGKNYYYIPFQFAPSGSTNLSSGKEFFTLILENGKSLSQGGNFFTIQIDPVSGSTRSFRP